MKAKKPTKKSKKTKLARTWLWVVGVILIAFVVFVWQQSYQQEQIRQQQQMAIAKDRQKFESAKKTVETIADRLRKADTSVKWEVSATCSRAHYVYGLGEAVCQINAYTSTSKVVRSDEEVENLIQQYYRVFKSSEDILTLSESKEISRSPSNFPAGLKPGSTGGIYYDKKTGIACGPLFEIRPEYDRYKQADPAQIILNMSFGCHGNSMDTYFPRSDI